MIKNETGYEKYIYMRMIRICKCYMCYMHSYRSEVTTSRGHPCVLIPTKRKA